MGTGVSIANIITCSEDCRGGVYTCRDAHSKATLRKKKNNGMLKHIVLRPLKVMNICLKVANPSAPLCLHLCSALSIAVRIPPRASVGPRRRRTTPSRTQSSRTCGRSRSRRSRGRSPVGTRTTRAALLQSECSCSHTFKTQKNMRKDVCCLSWA